MGEDRRPFLQILKSKTIENGEKGQVLPVCRQPERHHAFGGASGYVSGSDVFLDAILFLFSFVQSTDCKSHELALDIIISPKFL